MITIFIKATDKNNLRDLIRSLINNAEGRDNYQIFVGGEPGRDGEWAETIAEFRDSATVLLMSPGEVTAIDSSLVWMLSDEVFILGRLWDKRLLHYAGKSPDDIVVMFPTGYKPYGAKSEAEIAQVADQHPVISAKWAELVGLQDVEMICRSLFLRHGIDRRVDVRLVGVQNRGAALPQPAYDAKDVEKKADIIAEFILNDGTK